MNVIKTIETINKGGLVIGPTDTVYGILGDATNIDTVKRVYEAKKRANNKSLLVLVGNKDLLYKCVKEVNELEQLLIDKYMPGKLTIIFKKSDLINDLVTGGLDTVGIRMPDYKELLEVLNTVNKPLLSTSANISNMSTITNVEMIPEELKEYIDFIDDGGEIVANSSTIVKVENNKIIILRDGDLSNDIRLYFKDYVI